MESTLAVLRPLRCFLLLGWLFALPRPAVAQIIQSVDTAPNDHFSDRVTIAPSVTRIFGQLTPPDISESIYTTRETLNQGEVDTFIVSDLPPSEPFLVLLDTENIQANTILGLFDSDENLISFDDDSSPFGNLAPAIEGIVPDSGTIYVKVSGVGDTDFDGEEEYYHYGDDGCSEVTISSAHYQESNYTLAVLVGEAEIVSDVDYFSLSGLTPGDVFTVSESLSESGVMMIWLAGDGSVINTSSYSESNGRLQLSGIVPVDGQVHLMVSGYDDYSFDGSHSTSGDYLLTVETRTIGVQE